MRQQIVTKRFHALTLVLLMALSGWGATYYVSEVGAGGKTGADVGNASDVATFNGGAVPFNILDGDTVYFLGTITTPIIPPDGGTVDSLTILRGDLLGSECTFDGGGTTDRAINSLQSYISIIGFTITGTDTACVRSTGTGLRIESSTLTAAAGVILDTRQSAVVDGCTITSPGTYAMSCALSAAGSSVNITNSSIDMSDGSAAIIVAGSATGISVSMSNCTIVASSGSPQWVSTDGGTGRGTISLSGNTVTSSVAPSDAFVEATSGYALTATGNTLSLTNVAFAQTILECTDPSAICDISDNVVRVSDDVAFVDLAGNGGGYAHVVQRNDVLQTNSGGAGYIIKVGEETTGANDHTYDAVLITENALRSDNGGTIHAIYVGFSTNARVVRNRCIDTGYGVVVKGTTGFTYTSGGIASNIISGATTVGIRVKGVSGVPIYGNTLYNCVEGLDISDNVGSDPSTGTVIANNIISGGNCLVVSDTSTVSTSDWNANDLYTTGTYVSYQSQAKTYEEWEAMGYDGGSINSDPLFLNASQGDVRLKKASPCIDTGTNLGSSYDNDYYGYDRDLYGRGWDIGAIERRPKFLIGSN